MAAKQKAGLLGIMMGIVVIAMCAIAIVGVAIDEWTVRETDTAIGSADLSTSFGDYSDLVIGEEGEGIEDAFEDLEFDGKNPVAMRNAMVVFGYIAVAAVCVLAILYLLKMVLNFGLIRLFVGVFGILTLAAGAVLTGVTASYCANMVSIEIGSAFNTAMVMGVGAYLTCIGTMAGGIAAVVGVARK